ncbi:hypothetical protein E2C01_054747 [Portunus trituberculatus]|uniref:Uncharacterized protein n=1 Tax=Portunus trituberculatus TaxID=210409 RepID=A0A5B7GKN5_PORTR|nr:hypothetical protein [Portunus trituberculatus]
MASRGLGIIETIPRTLGVELGAIMSDGLLPSQDVSVGVSHKAPMLGNQTHMPCVGIGVCPSATMPGSHPLPRSGVNHMNPDKSEDSVEAGRPSAMPGGSGVGQSLSASMPVGHPLSTVESYEDDEEDVPPNQKGVSPFLHLIGQLSRDWYGQARSFYLPEGASLAPPLVNKELGGLRPVGNPAEKVCGSMADIASWTDQVLAAWAGASSTEQDVLEFLLALAKANKDILRPAEELHCRHLMLRRQAVVDSLPRTFSDRKKHQLLSSPFSDVLFDSVVVARVQEAAQQRALSSMV